MHVKENLFGEDQVFTPMDIVTSSTAGDNILLYEFSLEIHLSYRVSHSELDLITEGNAAFQHVKKTQTKNLNFSKILFACFI